MSQRVVWEFAKEPSGELLTALLVWATDRAAVCGMVVPLRAPVTSEKGRQLRVDLNPFLVASREVTEWPGTVSAEPAMCYEYEVTPEVAQRLVAACDRLYGWQTPDLPADVHLRREDGTVLLGSIAHEQASWLSLDEREFQEAIQRVAGLEESLTRPTQ
jgi:hypothetical protein